MSHGQTNGIPQGSALMDFIAEIVLGYSDLLLSQKIQDDIKDYQIIRYRDDYNIFTNNQQDANKLVKCLSEIFASLGLKLNSSKTESSNQVITSSIKKDKLYWICHKQHNNDLQQHLLLIHELATRYHNSGTIDKALHKYYKRVERIKNFKDKSQLMPIISILVDIAYKNPRAYSSIVAIISKLLKS